LAVPFALIWLVGPRGIDNQKDHAARRSSQPSPLNLDQFSPLIRNSPALGLVLPPCATSLSSLLPLT